MQGNIVRLLKDIEEAENNWNERASFELRGIKNLSVSDLEALKLYCNSIGNGRSLGKPYGYVKAVLDEYEIRDSRWDRLF